MNLHNYEPFDREQPLVNENWEKFCQEYIRLDLEDGIHQDRARRIQAYRNVYDSARDMRQSDVNVKAVALLRKNEVSERLAFLYEQECSGVESEVKWSKNKAEECLLNILYSPDTKPSDALKAISMMNELRQLGQFAEKKDNSIVDTVQEFFNRIGTK